MLCQFSDYTFESTGGLCFFSLVTLALGLLPLEAQLLCSWVDHIAWRGCIQAFHPTVLAKLLVKNQRQLSAISASHLRHSNLTEPQVTAAPVNIMWSRSTTQLSSVKPQNHKNEQNSWCFMPLCIGAVCRAPIDKRTKCRCIPQSVPVWS